MRSQGQKEGKSDEEDAGMDLREKKRDDSTSKEGRVRETREERRGERSEEAPEGREWEEKETALSLRKKKWVAFLERKRNLLENSFNYSPNQVEFGYALRFLASHVRGPVNNQCDHVTTGIYRGTSARVYVRV